jgi:hypothetical protein
MAQKIWWCSCAAKVDVFDEQIGGDHRFLTGSAAKDGCVVADPDHK